MYLHANAKLGLAGGVAVVRAIEGGLSLKAAAAAFNISPVRGRAVSFHAPFADVGNRSECRICSALVRNAGNCCGGSATFSI
jgi:hypothetical protein